MDINLGTGSEEDTVLVDEIYLAVGLQTAVNLGRVQIVNPVQRDPVGLLFPDRQVGGGSR